MPVTAMIIGNSDEAAAFLSGVDRGEHVRRGTAFLFTRTEASSPRRSA